MRHKLITIVLTFMTNEKIIKYLLGQVDELNKRKVQQTLSRLPKAKDLQNEQVG